MLKKSIQTENKSIEFNVFNRKNKPSKEEAI